MSTVEIKPPPYYEIYRLLALAEVFLEVDNRKAEKRVIYAAYRALSEYDDFLHDLNNEEK